MRRLIVCRGRTVIACCADVDAILSDLAIIHRAVLIAMIALFQQRILLQFLLDEFPDFQIIQLEQLDRLLQLRGHDKRLRLPQIQSLNQGHDVGARLLAWRPHARGPNHSARSRQSRMRT